MFEDTPLSDAVRDIGRAFGVEIAVADSALSRKLVTAAFSNQPLDLVLEEVTRAVGALRAGGPQHPDPQRADIDESPAGSTRNRTRAQR